MQGCLGPSRSFWGGRGVGVFIATLGSWFLGFAVFIGTEGAGSMK